MTKKTSIGGLEVVAQTVYLLWMRACSTLVVLSDGGVPAEF